MAWASLLEKEISSCRNEDKVSEKKINPSKTLISFSETLIYFSKTCSLADQIASLEAQLKTARLAQGAESTNAREILKSAARACESVDSTDEALASVGWALRKGRSPSWNPSHSHPPQPAPLREQHSTASERRVRAEELIRRVAHFTRGVMIGSGEFVDEWF